jgi:hydroxyacylglutathione hydrolase
MQISKHVHALKIPFKIPTAPEVSLDRFVYTFLIYGSEICLIDTGVASSINLIFDYIIKSGRNPEEISLIVQTHAHPDHIGSAKAIKEATGCSVAIHSLEKEWIEDVDLQFRDRPVPGFYNLVGGSASVDRILHDGETINLGNNMNLQVIHTPGHSKGSISLLCREDNVLFTGDAIMLPGDLPIYEDYEAIIQSLEKLKKIENIRYLLSSWDNPKKDEKVYEVMNTSLAYLQHIHQVVEKIYTPAIEPMELCKLVLAELELNSMVIAPMLTKSFLANVSALKKKS